MSFRVDFEPIGRRVSCAEGETLLDAAQRAGVVMAAACGGVGICEQCRVQVMAGRISSVGETEAAKFSVEELKSGWRLACQTQIHGDLRVNVPADSLVIAQRTQTEGHELDTALDPAVSAVEIEIPMPSIDDIRSDADRLREALGDRSLTFPTSVLRSLSSDLRAVHYHSTLFLRNHQIVGVRATNSRALGLAVDIGTTKIAGYLLDLKTGKTLASVGRMNPQMAYGEDVMARVSHVMTHPEGAEQLRGLIVDEVNALTRELCLQSRQSASDIMEAVVVGNTAMHHLFLGLPIRQLGLAPYVATESAALDLPSLDVGLDLAPGAYVHTLPNIAGFVGADHVAMLLGADLPSRGNVVLALDIGTNTEVSLIANGRHWACSTASGPAFEGAHIRHGMRAAPGAIERVILHDGRILLKTVGKHPPVGMCGSGILDLVAQMRHVGLLTKRGIFSSEDSVWRKHLTSQGNEFVVVRGDQNAGKEITLSLVDVNEIQLAKGAIRAGVNILLELAEVTEAAIDQVVVAGAFGTYLDVASGIEIGMFPRIERGRFKQLGNAAGTGARLALLSVAQREKARRIAQDVDYVELMTQKGFSTKYARALLF